MSKLAVKRRQTKERLWGEQPGRLDLLPLEGQRLTFRGVVCGLKLRRSRRNVLLKNITNIEGVVLTDHLWFNLTKGFAELELVVGDVIEFDARVKRYLKGYFGWKPWVKRSASVDLKLSHPTQIKKLFAKAEARRSARPARKNKAKARERDPEQELKIARLLESLEKEPGAFTQKRLNLKNLHLWIYPVVKQFLCTEAEEVPLVRRALRRLNMSQKARRALRSLIEPTQQTVAAVCSRFLLERIARRRVDPDVLGACREKAEELLALSQAGEERC